MKIVQKLKGFQLNILLSSESVPELHELSVVKLQQLNENICESVNQTNSINDIKIYKV